MEEVFQYYLTIFIHEWQKRKFWAYQRQDTKNNIGKTLYFQRLKTQMKVGF